jgi:hypothetical protein
MKFNERSQLGRLIILLWAFVASLCWFLPVSHNPDADYYYGVTLRLSRGEFLGSVDGLYSPLLSWAMAPLVALGVSLPYAYRLVNIVAFGVYLVGASRVLNLLTPSLGLKTSVLILVTLFSVESSVLLITSDLVAAAAFIWAIIYVCDPESFGKFDREVTISLFATLAYLGKNILFLIFPLTIVGVTACMIAMGRVQPRIAIPSALKVITLFILLCSPWIALISIKYGTLVISGQQLAFYGPLVARDFHPDLPREMYTAGMRHVSTSSLQSFDLYQSIIVTFQTVWYHVEQAASELYFQMQLWQAGPVVLVCWPLLLLYSLYLHFRDYRSRYRAVPFLLTGMIFLSIYLLIWGGRFRYFLPILPLLVFFAVDSGVHLYQRFRAEPRPLLPLSALRMLVVLAFFEIAIAMGNCCFFYSAGIDRELVRILMHTPALNEDSRPMTGNVDDPHAGLVAALLKREQWNTLDRFFDSDSHTINQKLLLWGASQIVWVGRKFPPLDELESFKLVHQQEVNGRNFRIFSRR